MELKTLRVVFPSRPTYILLVTFCVLLLSAYWLTIIGIVEANVRTSTTLVVSQVYGGGGGSTGTYLFDYVEIKNISSTQQSLSGLSIYYGSATGNFASSTGNVFALPAVTVNPGQYYLVQLERPVLLDRPYPYLRMRLRRASYYRLPLAKSLSSIPPHFLSTLVGLQQHRVRPASFLR